MCQCLGCGEIGSTLVGSLQNKLCLTDWGNRYAQLTDFDRLVPKKYLCPKTLYLQRPHECCPHLSIFPNAGVVEGYHFRARIGLPHLGRVQTVTAQKPVRHSSPSINLDGPLRSRFGIPRNQPRACMMWHVWAIQVQTSKYAQSPY